MHVRVGGILEEPLQSNGIGSESIDDETLPVCTSEHREREKEKQSGAINNKDNQQITTTQTAVNISIFSAVELHAPVRVHRAQSVMTSTTTPKEVHPKPTDYPYTH